MTISYVAKNTAFWAKGEYDRNIVITQLTDDRVKGQRMSGLGENKVRNFNVKRVGDRFSLGSGSGKCGFILIDASKVKK